SIRRSASTISFLTPSLPEQSPWEDPEMTLSRRGLITGALGLTAAAALAACGDDDDSSASTEGADAKTLTLWHYEGPTSAMGIAWTKAIEIFKTKHPGVEVKFEEKSFEQIQQ